MSDQFPPAFDVVADLREAAASSLAAAPGYIPSCLYSLAADEIERLRAKVNELQEFKEWYETR